MIESFIRIITPSSLDTLANLLLTSVQEADATGLAGGVLVVTPYSFALVSDGNSIVVFDSHAHVSGGALLAKVPASCCAEYLRCIFKTHYPQLHFCVEQTSLAGHFTFRS